MKSTKPAPAIRIAQIACVITALTLALVYLPRASFSPRTAYGPILHEERSDFSHIRVRGRDSQRSLLFVSESGSEQLQSSVDLDHPAELKVAYTKALFSSLLVQPDQKRILIIGLGGGGMVQFASRTFPEMVVEAVEIDPAVVRLADEYFNVRNSERVRIHTADAFDFVHREGARYDAIYLDAFLRPSVDLSSGTTTTRLKTVEFLEDMKARLKPGGLLSCNLISYRSTTDEDLAALGEVFSVVTVFEVKNTGNLAVLAHDQRDLASRDGLVRAAEEAERELGNVIPFRELVQAKRE